MILVVKRWAAAISLAGAFLGGGGLGWLAAQRFPTRPHPLAAPGARALPARADPVPGTWFRVGPNDTLSAISKRAYGTTRRVPDLLAANPGVDADRLRAGALLYVPKASERPPGTSPTAPRAAVPRVPSR